MKYYGSLHYDPALRSFAIQCEPHIALRLKRVFGKLYEGSHGVHTLHASDETARDLEWFIQRYPLEQSPAAEDALKRQADSHRATEQYLADFYGGRADISPFELAIPAREYQKQAATLWHRVKGYLLADDVGLGKTVSAIAGLTNPDLLPVVVVTLAHLPRQWELEVQRFAPQLSTHIINKSQPYQLSTSTLPGLNAVPDVLILSYHKLSGWASILSEIARSVVFDEIQELRRAESNRIPTKKYAGAKYLAHRMEHRLGLSATPIYNYGGEFFNVVDIVAPGKLGDRNEFTREWCEWGWGDKAKIKNPKAFGAYLKDSGIMLRRTRKDVAREIPPISKFTQTIDADTDALDKVSKSCAELAKFILRGEEVHRGEKMRASEQLSNVLRQATGIAKAPYVASFVRILIESGEKVVLYGWHRACFEIYMDQLKEFNPVMYTGSESAIAKDKSKDTFVNGDSQVLIISLRSGAGLDGLQYATKTVVFGELDWSPGVHEQCLSEDTEILTETGWAGVDDVHVSDSVAAFDLDSQSIEWAPVLNKTDRALGPNESMHVVDTEKISIRVTDEHRMIFRRKTRALDGVGRSSWEFATAGDLMGCSRRYVPVAGFQQAPGLSLTDAEFRLLGWIISDGYLNRKKKTLFIYQAAHQPWNANLIETLKACNIRWSVFQRYSPSNVLMNVYCIPQHANRYWSPEEFQALEDLSDDGSTISEIAHRLGRSNVAVSKKLRNLGVGREPQKGDGWFRLAAYIDKNLGEQFEKITREQLLHLIEGLWYGDGSKRSKKTKRITTTNKIFADRLQSLCVRRGISANISTRSGRTKAGSAIYDIWITNMLEAGVPRDGAFQRDESVKRPERVWCVTNRLGTIVTRRKGKVTIMGNCIGRVARDGQTDPVMAYYLVSESGADPVIVDVLGIKKQQIEGVRDHDKELFTKLQTDPNHIKKLAEAYLESKHS